MPAAPMKEQPSRHLRTAHAGQQAGVDRGYGRELPGGRRRDGGTCADAEAEPGVTAMWGAG
jgi:hypothetical protein